MSGKVVVVVVSEERELSHPYVSNVLTSLKDGEGASVRVLTLSSSDSSVDVLSGAFSVVVASPHQLRLAEHERLLEACSSHGVRRLLCSPLTRPLSPSSSSVDWRLKLLRSSERRGLQVELIALESGLPCDGASLHAMGTWDYQHRLFKVWRAPRGSLADLCLTSWKTSAQYAAAAAVDERKLPKWLHVRGDKINAGQLAEMYQTATGEQAKLAVVGDVRDLEKELRKQQQQDRDNIKACMESFAGLSYSGKVHNELFPHVQPETFVQIVKSGALEVQVVA